MKTISLFAAASLISLSSFGAVTAYEGRGATSEYGTQVCGMQIEELDGKLKLTLHGVGIAVQTVVPAKDGLQEFSFVLKGDSDIRKAMGDYFEEGGFLSNVSVTGTLKNSKPLSFKMKTKETVPGFGSETDSVKCRF